MPNDFVVGEGRENKPESRLIIGGERPWWKNVRVKQERRGRNSRRRTNRRARRTRR